MHRFLPVFLALLIVQPALAQNRYTSWTDPDAKTKPSDTRMEEMLKELNSMVDEASRARAADPVFLQDLRDLSRKYATQLPAPVRKTIISDSFSDGDFTRNPVWTVTSGEYRIESGWGLRSVAVATQHQSNHQPSGSDDPAAAILGAILQGALGGVSGSSGQKESPRPSVPAATIHTAAGVSNSFDMSLELSSWKSSGQFILGPYQGSRQQAGYRLVYSPGQRLDLVRIGSRGTFVINRSSRAVSLEDKKVHKLQWSRDANGRMQISVDQQVLIDFTDQSFRDPFQGLVITNSGTDVIVKSVTVTGG